jgi:hypothetical protein
MVGRGRRPDDFPAPPNGAMVDAMDPPR